VKFIKGEQLSHIIDDLKKSTNNVIKNEIETMNYQNLVPDPIIYSDPLPYNQPKKSNETNKIIYGFLIFATILMFIPLGITQILGFALYIIFIPLLVISICVSTFSYSNQRSRFS